MKTALVALPAAFLLVCQLAQSQVATRAPAPIDIKKCMNINCDCNALPSETWKEVCSIKELNLKNTCQKTMAEQIGYCSIHGPEANYLPLSINRETTSVEQSNSVKTINHKLAAIYWAMHKDLEHINTSVKQAKYDEAEQRLETIQANLENLFDFQKKMVAILNDTQNSAKAEQSWRNFAEDTDAVGASLAHIGNELLLTQADQPSSSPAKQAAINILQATGNVYEHVGYGYSKGIRYALSAQAWKSAAESSSTVLKNSPDAAPEAIEHYRYQTATRLHRASYNLLLTKDEEAAKETLEQSQLFVDEKQLGIEKITKSSEDSELITSY
ncbi:hypothetical protein P886_4301 [Alteromonadaceae bacterium 2753L.S.0a.02]|nr:hypothetical protein P886_4301 [Alteromonadaceae bacterium 2753L.S.0a.02]